MAEIEKNPFNNDPNITEFKITNAQAGYVVADGAVLTKDKTEAVIILPQFTKITLPDETTSIAAGAGQNVKMLQTIIGKSVKALEKPASSLQMLWKASICPSLKALASYHSAKSAA